ncbi:NAD-dependent epimerase/dehydratase family protein [Cytophagaceae bacterium DM2B3-1]|uniref:NAD-dependent epimerase/dehydratase family protein n=1 Tax=Xanthocytophaga flava TaxID=3048013 RepID=A0ABT7CDZ2_9BACT|nr:NAD-dependent epimerase/dehydratase family protein [Xanthocytophaga flavus]MDJ1473720.1 NAD-dependent epimerase/dehydratase family protein [Xanthocytophaga flavus]MDJ1491959.1 NAD-dependent epimerase/dehydratase family protein [Xanthocytophaga flavus]
MKILIIGSAGFIGYNAFKFFQKKGYQITGCDILANDLSWGISKYFQINTSYSDFEALFSSHTFDVCINASGSAHVGFSFEDPAKDFELNVLNVNKILVAIRKHAPKCRFINFSSAAVYGNPTKLPISEDTLLKPLSPYGFHKLQSEHLLTEYHKFFGLHTCNLRVFSAFGPKLKKQLFWDLYQKALNTNSIELFGTGEESRDFIYIEDLLQIVELVIQNAKFEGDVINVASGSETTIREAATTFYQLLDPKIEFSFSGKVKIGDPNNWCADIKKIQEIGFSPNYNLEEGLKKYVTWLKENA